MNGIHSFRLTAIGSLTREPELTVRGTSATVRFQLVGYDSIREGTDEDGPNESSTGLWFLAFGKIATGIGRYVHKGDLLLVEARVVPSSQVEPQKENHKEKGGGHSFLVTGYRIAAVNRGSFHG